MDKYICKTMPMGSSIKAKVPGSKSITNRALLIAALTGGKTTLRGCLESNDSADMIGALREIGINIKKQGDTTEVEGNIEVFGRKELREVNLGNAGTAARFMTALLSLSGGSYLVDCGEQMRKRPIAELLMALEEYGVIYEFVGEKYAFPFKVMGLRGNICNEININIEKSSQYLSALLIAGVLCEKGIKINVLGNRSARSYVGITMRMMEDFGVKVEMVDDNTYIVNEGSKYNAIEYDIEPDVSAACYFYGMAAILGGKALVEGVHMDSMQGDINFINLLKKMGCKVGDTEAGIVVEGPDGGRISGIDVNMSDFSDQTMTLAAMAPFATGEVKIRGISHIRLQESNRIKAIVTELGRMGVWCEEQEDGIDIRPSQPKAATIETYDDHRMAMAFAVTGCRAEGIVIDNPLCCKKTFENYFEVLTNLDLTVNI